MESTMIDSAIANFPNFAGFAIAILLLYRAHMKALDTIQKQHDSVLDCYKSMKNTEQ